MAALLAAPCFLIALQSVRDAATAQQQPYEWPYPSSVRPPTSTGAHVCGRYYPREALMANAEGVATLTFVVTKDGSVRDLKLVRSSGNSALDDASITCVRNFRYQPATENGHPVEVVRMVQQVWKLDFGHSQ